MSTDAVAGELGNSADHGAPSFWCWCRLQWDRVAAVVFGVLGAVLLVAGWVGLSGSVFPAEQIPYVASGGLGGIFCLGVAGTLWLGAELSDEWRKLDEICERVDAVILEAASAAGNGASANGHDHDDAPEAHRASVSRR